MFRFDPSLFHTFSFVAIFIASVAGSLHCVGMCGGLVALAGSSSRGVLLGQLGYHLGRGVGYVILGALAGLFGGVFIDTARSLLMPRSSLGGLIGLAVFLTLGLIAVLFTKRRGDGVVSINSASPLRGLRERLSRVPFTLGLSTAILPCPWLYSFVLLAAAGGGALMGMKVMVAFWLGTIPALIVVGSLFDATMRTLLTKYPRIQLVSIVLAFVLSVLAHVGHSIVGHNGHHHGHAEHTLH